jgi:hypothetical protein
VDTKHLLEEQVVRHLQEGAAVPAQHREHQVAVNGSAFEVFRQELNIVAEPKRSPDREE